MKKILAALVMLGTTLTLSQTALAQDAKAKGILEAASKKMKGLSTLQAKFSLSLKASNGKIRDTKAGTFYMKGDKYKVAMAGQEIICDGKTVWTYMKDANEVQVSTFNPSEATISPTKLFTNFYDKEYAYTYTGSKTVGGKACDIITMTPTSKTKQFNKVELAIDKSSTITGGTVYEKNGNQYVYLVSGFTPNKAMSDATFTYNAASHPGVEVVDLR